MTAVIQQAAGPVPAGAPLRSEGVWQAAWRRFRKDRVGVVSLIVVAAFLLLILLSATGLVAGGWQNEVAVPNAPPTVMGARAADPSQPKAEDLAPNVDLADIDPLAPRYGEWAERAKQYHAVETPKAETLPLGADRLGRNVLDKAIKGTQVSVFVGVLAALVATLVGTALGAFAGFFGGKVGDFLEWLYNVFTAIPYILLIFAFAAVLGRGIGTVVLILGLTGWTDLYRQVRAEFMKHRAREYVRAAEAIGASSMSSPSTALRRACSPRTSVVSTPMPPPPGSAPMGGFRASRAVEPGGATSSQRISPCSPNATSARSSKPSVPV